mmetsp:Transcript_10654/g.65682  ORF Transcript_10654/g.65682 Transcript_10654/m.65682 type:complete len:213 (-) Transcript_10654:533-1171(-)
MHGLPAAFLASIFVLFASVLVPLVERCRLHRQRGCWYCLTKHRLLFYRCVRTLKIQSYRSYLLKKQAWKPGPSNPFCSFRKRKLNLGSQHRPLVPRTGLCLPLQVQYHPVSPRDVQSHHLFLPRVATYGYVPSYHCPHVQRHEQTPPRGTRCHHTIQRLPYFCLWKPRTQTIPRNLAMDEVLLFLSIHRSHLVQRCMPSAHSHLLPMDEGFR